MNLHVGSPLKPIGLSCNCNRSNNGFRFDFNKRFQFYKRCLNCRTRWSSILYYGSGRLTVTTYFFYANWRYEDADCECWQQRRPATTTRSRQRCTNNNKPTICQWKCNSSYHNQKKLYPPTSKGQQRNVRQLQTCQYWTKYEQGCANRTMYASLRRNCQGTTCQFTIF